MSIRLPALAGALAMCVLAGGPARAAKFDLLHVDHIDVTLCNGCGITLAGADFALFVNKGAGDVGAAEFFGTTFTSTSSHPDLTLSPFVNNPGPPVAPIHPNEAVGSVGWLAPFVGPLLLAGEVIRDTAPLQVIAFGISRANNSTYVGPVTFDVTMQTGNEFVNFSIRADVHLGPHEIQFLSAARVSSQPGPTAAKRSTWGKLKALYR